MSDVFNWVSPVSGDWTTTGDWSLPGFPDGAADAAVIGATGNGYTVTLGGGDTLITVATLAITYSSASLNIAAAGGPESVLGNLTNDGAVNLDDEYYGVGGSTLAVGGTLVNAGNFYIGGSALGAPTTLIAAALVNTGLLQVTATGLGAADTASVLIGGAAGFGTLGVLTGQVNLNGAVQLSFAGGGQIGTIASGARLQLYGDASVADQGGGVNSALSGLTANAGELSLADDTLTIAGNLSSTGQIDLDDQYYGVGGSTLTVGGTLVNAGNFYIGGSALGAPTTLIAAALVNTGVLQVAATGIGPADTASVLIGSAAGFGTLGVLTGQVNLNGAVQLSFAGGGQIGTIASGAQLELYGGAHIADGTDTTNSALQGLALNAGELRLDQTTLTVTGGLTNTGQIDQDNAYYASGGALLATAGTLTNSGQINLGDTNIGTSSTLTAAALVNTGGLYVAGNTSASSPTATASVLIGGMAGFGTLGVLTGQVNTDGFGRIAFVGGGQIATIAAGAQLQLFDHSAIADGTDTTNSALQGLALNAGELRIDLTTLTVTGGLTNTGQIDQDNAYYASGGALTAIAGTLTNSGQINLGDTNIGTSSTLTAAALVNTGGLYVAGNTSASSPTATASVLIGGMAGFGTLGVLTGQVNTDGFGRIAFVGGGQIATIAAGAQLQLFDHSAIADGTDTTNSALQGLALNAGELRIDLTTLTVTGGLTNTGQIDQDNAYYASGGALTAVGGTLTNSGQINLGDTNIGTSSTLTAAALVNTGGLYVAGNTSASSPTATASVLIGGMAGFGTLGVLTGQVNTDGFGRIAFAGGGQIATIAAGAQLQLFDHSAIADGTDTTNSALQGLALNAGELRIDLTTLTVTGGLTNTGQIDQDNAYYASGGALVAIGGTLVNTGVVNLGDTNIGNASTLTAAALVNSGNLNVQGDNATGSTDVADLLIGGAAGFGTVGVLTGNVYMDGHGTIAFAGGGQITTIAAGAALQMRDLSAIADGTDSTSTALQGLTENDGDLTIAYDTLSVTGGLTNTDQINLDNAYYGAGGGLIAIGGTLVNTAQVTIGDGNIASNTTMTAGGLVNTGNLQVTGNGSIAAVLEIGGTAVNESVVGVNAGATVAATGTYTQQADNTQVYGTLAAATVAVTGGVLDGGGTIAGVLTNLGGGTVQGGTAGSPGTLGITGSYTQAGSGLLNETFNGQVASQLAVSGAVALGGTLDLSLLNGATLAAGDDIVVLTAGALSGTFATINDGGLSAAGTSSIAIGNGLYLNPVYDDAAGVMRLVVSATAVTPPQINAPATLLLNAGTTVPITTISVSAQAPGTISVQLSDGSGLLAATGAISGDDSTALTLEGTVAAVNQELASLTDTPQGSATTDRLTVTVTDSTLQVASDTVVVTIDQPPSITLPATVLAAPGQPDPLGGISVADPGAVATGLTLTAVLSDNAGLLEATAAGAGTISGNDSTQITLTGTLGDINAELASLTFSGGAADTLTISVADGRGGSAAGTLAIDVSPPPAISVPTATQPEFNAITQTISGIAVSAPAGAPAGQVFSLTVSAQSGLLAATAGGGATVSGDGTSQLTLTGTAAALNTTLSALSYTGPASGTADTITIATPNGQGGSTAQSVAVALSAPPPPTLILRTAQAANAGTLAPIDGLSVQDGAGESASTTITVTLSDSSGLLGLQNPNGGASVSGEGTTALTISGTAAQVNDDLAQLTFLYPAATSAATLDTINISAMADGATATSGVPIGNALTSTGAPDAPPPPLEYTGALPVDEQSTVGGLKVTDGDIDTYYFTVPASGGIQFAIGLDDNDPTAVTVNDSLQPDTPDTGFQTEGGGPVSIAPLTVDYLLTAVDPDPQVGDQISYVVGGDDGDGHTLPDERIMLQVVSPATYAGLVNNGGGGGGPGGNGTGSGNGGGIGIGGTGDGGDGGDGDDDGDVHLQTFDGLYYNFQSAGEFVLAKSTIPGNTFQVQIRTQPYYNGAGASVTTEVAAAIGTDRVTFDLFRAATVWVDGSPVTLSANGLPMDLSGGTLSQLSATSWLLDYNTGQTLVVTEYATFLNVQVGLPAGSAADVQGLLGTDSGVLANEFTLPNGTVLTQPLSFTDLYTTWANAWRITQANSLLDYGSGQTTQSFTDMNFPTDSVPTSLFPAQVVAQAESLVAAAGITDPGAAQAAEEDYLLTGDTSFIAADATTAPTQAIAAEPTTPAPASAVGIAADASLVVEAAAGPTPVVFSIYRTGDDSSAQVVDYAAQSADFPADLLPSGQVTLAAGVTLTMVTIDVTGTLGNAPTAALSVTINTGTTGVPVLAPTADVTISNNQPVPGTPAAPVFENASAVGTITQVGNAYTLDLGTFDLDAQPPSLAVALVNDAAAPADALSGNFTLSAAEGIGVVSGSGPVTNLGAGRDITLQLAADTDSVGSFTQTITFDANEANASGFQAALGNITLTVTDTVAPPVSASVTPAVVNFGTIHAGTTLDQAITVTNTGSTPIAATTSTSGDATASGRINALAAGGIDDSSILVGLGTDVDGKQSGSVTLAIASPGGSGSATGLLLPPASVTGSGAFNNAASLLADGVLPPVGAADGGADVVSWTDPATVFTYDLGSVQTVAGVLASVDALGTYVVSASTDGTNFAPLFTITPEGTASGLTTVASLSGSPYDDPLISFAPTQAQYLRLQAIGGDGTYAAGELDFFAATPTVAVSGTIFNLATAAVSVPQNVILHVGDPGTLSLGVANAAAADGYGENLIAALSSVSGGVTIVAGGSTGDIAPGATDAGAFQLDFSTAQTGNINAGATLALISDGTGIDGLGQTTLAADSVPINIVIDNYATAALQQLPGSNSFGTIGGGVSAQTLDIGTFEHDSGSLVIGLGVANTASGPADDLSGSITATGAFTADGFGAVPELGAGGADTTPTLTLSTANDGVFTETVTLAATDSNAAGYSAALPGQTLVVTGTIADLPPPVISVASSLTAYQDMPTLVGPLTISDPNTLSQLVTVTVSDMVGTLAAMPSGAASVTQTGSNVVVLTGDLADVNTELASLTYTAAVLGADAINIAVTDQQRATASTTIAVTDAPVPITDAVLNAPGTVIAIEGAESGVAGLSITDPYAESSGEVITAEFTSPDANLSVTGSYGATIIGQGTGTLFITGTVQQINAYLSDDLIQFLIGQLGNFEDTSGLPPISGSLSSQSGEDLVAAAGGPEGKFFQVGVLAASYALNALISLIPGNGPAPTLQQFYIDLAKILIGWGDSHIITSNGLLYNFDAQGEFVLATSTQAGDSFDVQVRLQPLDGSTSNTAITQVAAAVGSDRVTFAVGRAQTVWVDGAPVTLNGSTPMALNGGQLTQLSANSYQILWNTGEVITVQNTGPLLDVSVAPGPNNGTGDITGLLSLTTTQGNELTLPDGTVLQQPLTTAELYNEFANAWRVPQQYSLLDYGPGQSTLTFTDTSFPTGIVTLDDLPSSVVAAAASVVAAAGITDPNIAAAAEMDYITSGGNLSVVLADAAITTGLTTNAAQVTPTGPVPVELGVIAAAPTTIATAGTITPVVFDAYLTNTTSTDTVVNYAVVAAGAGFIDAGAFGGTLPSGSVTIAAGQSIAAFTIDLPQDALGTLATEAMEVQITAADGTALFTSGAQATIDQAIAGPPPVPQLVSLTNVGSLSQDGNTYTLDLGDVQYGEILPSLQFAIENTASAGSDLLGGSFSATSVVGFTVSGDSLPSALGGGDSYYGLNVQVNQIKFGANEETITFTPTDTNATGYATTLPPITLNITDAIVPPTMVYSYAYGDVHIITYNGTYYNFQAEGEFTLAQSRLPGDSFDIQLRLQQLNSTASVTYITQVADSVGTDRVTFDPSRSDFVQVNGAATAISLANPVINLAGGTLTELSSAVFRINWNTGEEVTVTDEGTYINVADGIPLSEPDDVGGLQGEDAGQADDFQLSNGTVLQQPLTTAELYGEFADSWRVSQASSLFDYLPGQTTATFTDTAFPTDVISLADLPASVVAQAASVVAAAGITDPNIAAGAELDYIASGNMNAVQGAADVQSQIVATTAAPITPPAAPTPAAGVQAAAGGVVESATGTTAVVFDVYLTGTETADTPISYAVVNTGSGDLGAAAYGGVLPSGTVTIAAGQTLIPFTIDLPQGALGTSPSGVVAVQISASASVPLFAPDASAVVVNNAAEPGAPAVPELAELSAVGTLIQNGDSYTLDLGALAQGQAVPVIQLALSNAAVAPADSLSGTFGVPQGSGFTVVGNGLSAAIAPGMDYSGLYVGATTANLGTHSETLSFTPLDVNDSGYIGTLAPITLTVEDAITAPATAAINTPSEIIFPNVRLDTAESHAVSITNSATAPAAALDVSVGTQGYAVATGSIDALAAGQTDATDISAGLDTGYAGRVAGIVTLTPASDTGLGTSTTLATAPQIDVFGNVYRPADPSVAPLDVYARVGDPGVAALSVTNADPTDGFSENLIAALTSVSSGIGIGSAGPTGDIAAGDSDQSLTLTYSTAQAGVITGSATLAATTDGGTGAGSIDGLGTLALAPVDVPVNITVDNLAQATFEYDGNTITGGTLDLGDLPGGLQQTIIDLGVLNNATGPADLLSGSYTLSGGDGAFGYTPGSFSSVSAGAAFNALQVLFNSAQPGTFVATVTLSAESTLPNGTDPIALPDQTLTLVADVMPCFLAGTRLATPSGPVAVETLSVGDRVRTEDGGSRPVVWIGQRVVDCAGHADPASVLPVRIKRGAFGRGLPARDLLLSPDHAVYAEGVLIPVRYLIDGVRIVQRPARRAHYFHVELDRHDIVLAEGLPVESYLDVGDRARFDSIGAAPLARADHAARAWDSDGCAPLCVTGPALDRVRARLRKGRPGLRPGPAGDKSPLPIPFNRRMNGGLGPQAPAGPGQSPGLRMPAHPSA